MWLPALAGRRQMWRISKQTKIHQNKPKLPNRYQRILNYRYIEYLFPLLSSDVCTSHGSVSVFQVGIGFSVSVYRSVFFQVRSVQYLTIVVGYSKYRDIGSVCHFALKAPRVDPKFWLKIRVPIYLAGRSSPHRRRLPGGRWHGSELSSWMRRTYN